MSCIWFKLISQTIAGSVRSFFYHISALHWALKKKARSLSTADQRILEGLVQDGFYVTSLQDLKIDATATMYTAAYKLRDHFQKPSSTARKSFVENISEETLMEYPEIIRWGLQERLLDIVEQYLRVPIVYRGVVVRRDVANGENKETRLWHRDNEDRRIVKIIVYLSDVDAEGGPFECIPKRYTPPIPKLTFTAGRVLDHDMAKVVSPSLWASCHGPAGTVSFADTCSVFHRGKMPVARDRLTLFFCYNSRSPRRSEFCAPLFSKEKFLARVRDLSARQQQAIV